MLGRSLKRQSKARYGDAVFYRVDVPALINGDMFVDGLLDRYHVFVFVPDQTSRIVVMSLSCHAF